MSNLAVIRPYDPRDRAAVREICCDTADAGKPVEAFFRDREIFADLITRYYTDREPDLIWVAESDSRVVGYLMGCLDTRRFLGVMKFRLGPALLLKAVGRGLLWDAMIWRIVTANWRSIVTLRFRRDLPLDEYPAHLHVNLQTGFRGQKVGPKLVSLFCDRARAAGVRGVHAGVSAANAAACRFFERQGFVPVGHEPGLRMPHAGNRVLMTVVYGKRL